MRAKTILKKGIRTVYKVNRQLYRIFFVAPVLAYKKRHCAAINDFKFYKTFSYDEKNYYPAILKKGERTSDKIYKRIVRFDSEGIPMVKGFEQEYWPVTIVQYGLLNYNYFLTYHDEKFKIKIRNICEWLVDNIADSGMWEYHVVYHSTVVNEDLIPPYGSAMVQGEAISLLVRGYYLFNEGTYLECAFRALRPYEVLVKDGGIREELYGLPFYEEYPTKTPSLVLNGFMFSLFGLYDFSKTGHIGAERADKLFRDGADTLIKLLPLYDGGFCSRYDLSHITCAPNNTNKNPFYHAIHVNQLIALNSVLNSEVLDYYIKEWR